MKTYQEFINESQLNEAKVWPLGLSKKNTYKFTMFRGSSADGKEAFDNLRKNGYTFLDLNYNKITSSSKISDIAYIETGKNSPRDISDDFDDYGVVAKTKM